MNFTLGLDTPSGVADSNRGAAEPDPRTAEAAPERAPTEAGAKPPKRRATEEPREAQPGSSQQRELTRLVARVAFLLFHFGAESRVVVDLGRRLGLALGLEEVDIALTSSAVMVTGRCKGHCITTIRASTSTLTNMRVVSGIEKLCIAAERGHLGLHEFTKALDKIHPKRYPAWLVVPMIGLSCAAFCRLSGGGWAACGVTFLASSGGMLVRNYLMRQAFNLLVTFAVTAFATSLLAGLGRQLGLPDKQVFLAMAASVLMLVPGFPLINAVSDMLKGFVTVGLSRWVRAGLLTLATSMGIVLAMQILGAWAWI